MIYDLWFANWILWLSIATLNNQKVNASSCLLLKCLCEILHHQKDGWNMLKTYKLWDKHPSTGDISSTSGADFDSCTSVFSSAEDPGSAQALTALLRWVPETLCRVGGEKNTERSPWKFWKYVENVEKYLQILANTGIAGKYWIKIGKIRGKWNNIWDICVEKRRRLHMLAIDDMWTYGMKLDVRVDFRRLQEKSRKTLPYNLPKNQMLVART